MILSQIQIVNCRSKIRNLQISVVTIWWKKIEDDLSIHVNQLELFLLTNLNTVKFICTIHLNMYINTIPACCFVFRNSYPSLYTAPSLSLSFSQTSAFMLAYVLSILLMIRVLGIAFDKFQDYFSFLFLKIIILNQQRNLSLSLSVNHVTWKVWFFVSVS